ncbi:MAG: hypothetical protein JRI35_09955, partial [Deltaproteobacteria bacterium]|nr:hypothetical protein [Deltaproteobacteria bacterium]
MPKRDGLERILIFLSMGLVVWPCILTKARGQALNKEVKIVRKSNVREVASLDGTWQIVFDP